MFPSRCTILGRQEIAFQFVEAEKKCLATINKEFAALPGDKHYVLGTTASRAHVMSVPEWRKPFNILAEGLLSSGVGATGVRLNRCSQRTSMRR